MHRGFALGFTLFQFTKPFIFCVIFIWCPGHILSRMVRCIHRSAKNLFHKHIECIWLSFLNWWHITCLTCTLNTSIIGRAVLIESYGDDIIYSLELSEHIHSYHLGLSVERKYHSLQRFALSFQTIDYIWLKSSTLQSGI